ncbi:MAG TPA: glycoside hydrolase family 3 C-terminal domain-containing protein [Anaerolineae bacterium]|nr:glycoside hydrolase family 3 C-terminal domain-containing protein [Anaerolineae bacterium]
MNNTEKINKIIREMTLEEKAAMIRGKDFWNTGAVERLGVPSICMTDGPHGVRLQATDGGISDFHNTKKATCFPAQCAVAASWDTQLVREMGEAIAQECQALGVHIILGPGANIKRTPLCGRNFEYYSEDPVLTGELGAAFVNGVQSQGVGTSVKHFVCNNQEYERMTISAEVDERTLRETYLAGFERIVKESDPWTVMAAYNRVNGTFVCESHHLLTEILKEEWNFQGLVVSDWGAVYLRDKALAAGLDLEMPGYEGLNDSKIIQKVKNGQLDEKVLNEAIRRILRIVFMAVEGEKGAATFDPDAHHALARRIAGESIVLLKNADDILPLDKQLRSLAVIGRFARSPRYQGEGSSRINPTKLDTAYAEVTKLLGEAAELVYADGYSDADRPDEELIREAVQIAKRVEAAIVFAGLPASYESEGFDRSHLDMPPSHNELIEAVCRAQPNTVVVLSNGSAVTMPWVRLPKAILEGWVTGQASGGAIADVLFGLVNPSGKLPETFPVRLEDTPAYINYPGEEDKVRYGEGLFVGYKYYEKKRAKPLFPFGFGLSYTTFEYSDLKLSHSTITDRETLKVSLKVKNTGRVAGKEVVQLYVRDVESRLVRPEKELKAFAKVGLEPGEEKEVCFELSGRDFAYYDSVRKTWSIESGDFEVLIGSSSGDLRAKARVNMESSQELKTTFHTLLPIKYFLDDSVAAPIFREVLAGLPLIEALSSSGHENPIMKIMKEFPIAKLINLNAGAVDEKQLDDLVSLINSRTSD